MNWAIILVRVPVVIYMGLDMEPHIDNHSKERENFVWRNWLPGLLIEAIIKSRIVCSWNDVTFSNSFCVGICTLYD
jgi:hypothetical protein